MRAVLLLLIVTFFSVICAQEVPPKVDPSQEIAETVSNNKNLETILKDVKELLINNGYTSGNQLIDEIRKLATIVDELKLKDKVDDES
uniref:Putative secreted protein n=1 Tax=Lutzomyia longipalpis TaxID=7200 RepID=A0A1B0GHU1_LUTLO